VVGKELDEVLSGDVGRLLGTSTDARGECMLGWASCDSVSDGGTRDIASQVVPMHSRHADLMNLAMWHVRAAGNCCCVRYLDGLCHRT
jgi:hypothetical protein